MDFAFTDEQLMIQESAAGFLVKASDSSAVRAAMATPTGFDPALWQQIAQELYWPALIIPEAYGGLGLGFVEQAILLEQMGKRLLCAPFFSSACLATPALLLAPNEALRETYLPAMAAGELRATLAFNLKRGDFASAEQASVSAAADGYVLNGHFNAVIDGASADLLIVCARFADQRVGLFAVPKDSPGLSSETLVTLDQTRRQAEVRLTEVAVSADQCLSDDASALIEKVLHIGAIALACEQVGGAQQTLDLTLAYINERKQFNRTIASFQAIKHRCADLMLFIENARSAVYYAACVAHEALSTDGDALLAGELSEASAIAKSEASETFMHCAGESIQLHGGVGFTWEYDPHLYFKRARASEQMLGSPSVHRERLACLLLENRP